MGILRQALVAHLGKSELALHDAKDMLDLGPHARLVAVAGALRFGQFAVPAALVLSKIAGPGRLIGNGLCLAGVGRITPHPGFLSVEQVANNDRIVDVGGRGYHGMDQFGSTVDADMGLHAEEPLITLPGLMHLRVALLFLVLGRTGRIDNRGVDDSAAIHLQPVLIQILVNQVEQLIAQIMILHQVTELADRGFVGNGLLTQVNADEAAHGARIVEGFLGGGIGQVEPVLQEVNTQHSFDADRAPPSALRIGIERLDGFQSSFQGIMTSMSSRNCSLRVLLRYFSKPSVNDFCFIGRVIPVNG